MNKLKCQIQGHNEKEIVNICFDKNCKNKRLCCLPCMKSLHQTHSNLMVDVDDMNTFIQQVNSKQIQDPSTHSYGQKQILQGLEQLNSLVLSFQKIIKEKIEKLKQQSFQDILQKASDCQQGIEYWNQLLEDMLQYVSVDNSVINLPTSKEGQLNEMEEREIKIIKQSEQSLQNIINQITLSQIKNDSQTQIQTIQPTQIQSTQIQSTQIQIDSPIQIKIERLCFDQTRKHVSIASIDQWTIQNSTSKSLAMAYAKEGFDPSEQSYAFAFNIQKMSVHGVLVGVGNDEGSNVPSYLFGNQTTIGHGQYMMSNYGCIYHHTDEQFNDKQKGINFDTGDKISIKYNHATKELEFRNSQAKVAVFKMLITDMKKRLYPCVMFQGTKSQVQLMEY